MVERKHWTLAELTRDAEAAKTPLRWRLDEPPRLYSAFLETFKRSFGQLIGQLPALRDAPVVSKKIADRAPIWILSDRPNGPDAERLPEFASA